jgi:hypothetical protein
VLPTTGEGAHVAAQVDRRRAGLGGHRHRLGHGVAPAHDEVAAAVAQGRPQIGQRLDQEADPVGGAVVAVEDLGVDDEQRHHRRRRAARLGQGRVVAHPQVAGEQDDHRVHAYPLFTVEAKLDT